MKSNLVISNLSVAVEGKKVLSDINLAIKSGKIHLLMGPNGSGKSTLALSLMGHPDYQITSGQVLLNNQDLLKLNTEQRAKKGLFLTFQNPVALSGVPLIKLLLTAQKSVSQKNIDVLSFDNNLKKEAKKLTMSDELLERSVNDGFSGGERKKSEVLQLLTLKPKFVILDEIDTGLDIDALRVVALAISEQVKKGLGVILITHYGRILEFLKPDAVYILNKGKIVKSGNLSLVEKIEKKGYEQASI